MTNEEIKICFQKRLEFIPVAELAKEFNVTRSYIYLLLSRFPHRAGKLPDYIEPIDPKIGAEICWDYYSLRNDDPDRAIEYYIQRGYSEDAILECLYAMTDKRFSCTYVGRYPSVEQWRRQHNLSNAELAKQCHVAPATLKRYMSAYSDPNIMLPAHLVESLSQVTGLSPEQIVSEDPKYQRATQYIKTMAEANNAKK